MDKISEYYETLVQSPIRELRARSRSRSSGTNVVVHPSKKKVMCKNGFESCSYNYKEYDRSIFDNDGQFLVEVLSDAPMRRRRGTFRPDAVKHEKGCSLRAGIAQECTMTMFTKVNPCSWLNIAASASASASPDGLIHAANSAVDLNEGSSYEPGAASDGQYWLAVDLGQERDLCRAEIKMQTDALAPYLVQGSLNGVDWIDFTSQTWGYNEWEGFEFPVASRGRWVRIISARRFSIYEVELYPRSLRFERRAQDDINTEEFKNCAAGQGSQTSCCEACLECRTLSCVLDMPNCTNLLAQAYTDCYQVRIDMNCCKALFWGFSTLGFACAICCLACFCWHLKRQKKKREHKQTKHLMAKMKLGMHMPKHLKRAHSEGTISNASTDADSYVTETTGLGNSHQLHDEWHTGI